MGNKDVPTAKPIHLPFGAVIASRWPCIRKAEPGGQARYFVSPDLPRLHSEQVVRRLLGELSPPFETGIM